MYGIKESDYQFFIQICRSEVDFFLKKRISKGELECLQSHEFYPPRFQVFFASHQENPTLTGGKIAFRGTTSDIEFDTYFNFPDNLPITPPAGKHSDIFSSN